MARKKAVGTTRAARGAGGPRVVVRPAAALAPSQPTLEQQRQMILLMLERKFRSLLHCAQELNQRLQDPQSPRILIETHLASNGAERQLVLARHDQIQNGSQFRFPSEADLQALRAAIANLETAVARTAAVEALIQAGNTVIETVRANTV